MGLKHKVPKKQPQVFKSEYQGIPVLPDEVPGASAAIATAHMMEHLQANPPKVDTGALTEYYEERVVGPQNDEEPLQDKTPADGPEEPTEGSEELSVNVNKDLRPANWGYIGRKDCLAFEEAKDKDGNTLMTERGPVYHVRRVPVEKGKLYCTECHQYLKFKSAGDSKLCPQCGISTNDHYIKTANGLWPSMPKK